MQTARLGSAALIAVLLLAAWPPTAPLAEDVLTFDTNGDGVPDLTIPDGDGNGTFEWPPGTRTLHGTLRFPAGHVIEFSGYTTIKVDAVVVEQGATLVEGLNLHQIVFTATHGDFTSQGRLRFGFFPGRFGVNRAAGERLPRRLVLPRSHHGVAAGAARLDHHPSRSEQLRAGPSSPDR